MRNDQQAVIHCKICLANIYNAEGICYECLEDEASTDKN